MTPNLSLNPDASPAALARRPLGAGQLGSLGIAVNALARLAAELNAVHVTVKDLLRASEEIHKLPEDERDWEGRAIVLARMYSGEGRKAMAVEHRLTAMAHLIDSGALPHWVLPKRPDGAVMISEPVFTAAATEPLLLAKREAYFDRERFVSKVLELAEPDGNA